ncbi:MAG: pyridoxal phosphate-dependent aminotransferase [Chloroflexota bacterium]
MELTLTHFASRVRGLEAEGAYATLAKAQAYEAQGRAILHLEIGQPDIPTYEPIRRAGIRAIEEGYTRYTPSAGISQLREAIAKQAGEQRNLVFSADEVVVGPGAKPALFFPTLALVEAGDAVFYPDPGFPTYRAMIEVAGGVPVAVPLREEEDFSFDLDVLERLIQAQIQEGHRIRMIILNSPSNPTGGVLGKMALERLAEIAEHYDCWLLSDEIYARLSYGEVIESIASVPGMKARTIICDGFSKTYAMTGWRLGYGIMPVELARRVELLLTHSIGCTASFTQLAGLEAISMPQDAVERTVKEYQRRRDALVQGLNQLAGIRCRSPKGAFYVFPNISAYGKSSAWMADYLLDEAGVALLPGTAFGEFGEGYLRLCFANSMDNLLAAVERIGEALSKL